MAARPGEDLAATLFADVHYYYGPPTAKPPHHRFDKSSYVYLFENASQRRARVEVANNAGTPEQDAFNGCLDNAHVNYSYKHSTLVTVTVDGTGQSAGQNTEEWHLPTYDPRNETKYMYRLHTVDLYFWAKEDAIVFLNATRRVLPTHQITILDEPLAPPPHQDEMSPVVQQLENIAITDPSYQHGQTRDSRTTAGSTNTPPSATTSLPGPPISATPHNIEASNFAPMAYNPAAPAAPEVIHHREKTPPPEDGAGNPLVAAASSDQGQVPTFGAPPYGQQGFSGPPQQPGNYFTGPPASAPPSQFQPQSILQQQQRPPPSAGLTSPYAAHFQNSFAPPPTGEVPRNAPYASPPPQTQSQPPAPPAYQQQQQQQQAHIPVTQQFAQYPLSPGLSSPGMNTPGIYSPGFSPPPGQPQSHSAQGNPNAQFMPPLTAAPPPSQNPNAQFMPSPTASFSSATPSHEPPAHPGLQHSATAPPGGFSQYSYAQAQQVGGGRGAEYAIHQQVYRPTEGEAYKKPKESKEPKGKLEERAGKLEKGVSGLFKKLEKRMG